MKLIHLLGLCCHRADCEHHHCPGREIALDAEASAESTEAREPLWPAITGGVIGFVFACAAAAACMGAQIFPF